MGGVNDVSKQCIVLEPGFATLTWLEPEPDKEFNQDFSGMSGGPVFRIVDQGVLRLELVGIIYEYVNTDAVLARHADVVQADGIIIPY
jgi:hypothetical protein